MGWLAGWLVNADTMSVTPQCRNRQMLPELVIESPAALPGVVAAFLEREITAAIRGRGTCAAALAGGNTPRSIYALLGQPPFATRLDWERIEIFFSDERAVPPDHPDSNYGMVRSTLIDRLPKPPVVHRMEAERSDLERAAAEYSDLLPERLDLLILGMGEDGHTASLFPNSPALHVMDRKVVPVIGPKPPAQRLTITPPVIEGARRIVVIVMGDNKAHMVARALRGPFDPTQIPIQLALGGTWFLDNAAAGEIA